MIKKIPLFLSMALICCSFTACGSDGDTVSSHADEGNRVTENTDGFHDEEKNTTDSQNVVEEIVTDAGNAVDDLVSEGEEIITDIGGAVEDMVDGTGTSTTETTR